MTYVIVAALAIALVAAGSELYSRTVNRKRLGPLVRGIEEMRRMATRDITRRPASPGDLAADVLPSYEAAAREVREQGLTLLGDLVELYPDGRSAGVTRWFVDGLRTTCGWFGVTRSREAGAITPAMLLFSESDSGEFFVTTRGGSRTSLAGPPFVHRTHLDWGEGLARVAERHRAEATPGSGGRSALRRVEQLDEAVALLGRLRESGARWRASQPPADLLEADVRSVLQERFSELGPLVMKLMSSGRTSTPVQPQCARPPNPQAGITVSTPHPNQLDVPPGPAADAKAFELARVWSSQGHQYYVLNVKPFDDPTVWGILALDVMKHAARAYQQLDGRSKEEAYKRILAGFTAEMQHPTEPL